MKYSRNAVYTRLVNAIRESYPSAYCTSRKVAKPSSFPACYIHEIDRNRPLQYTQIDFEDVQWESVFEIQIVSAKANTAATEAYGIMDIARQAFNDLYYREFTETNIDNGDTFTLVGRFRRVIGGGDEMPIVSA
jgi:hypothetical protein